MGKIKEFLKGCLVEHERLYWYIVVGLAVFAFGLITVFGMAKLEKAEAAEINTDVMVTIDGNNIPDIRSLDWSNFTEYFETEFGYTGNIGEKIIREHKYCVVTINSYCWPNEVQFVKYLFTNEPVQYEANSGFWLLADWNSSVTFEWRNGEVYSFRGYGRNNWSYDTYENVIPFVVDSDNSSTKVIASTYDFRNGQLNYHNSYVQIDYPAVRLDVEYSSSAPYLKDVTFSNVNLFLIDGNTDFTQSTFKYTFELGNADNEYVSRKIQISGYVCLPSKEFIDNATTYYLGGRDTLDEYHSIYSCEYYPTWLTSLDLGDGSSFKKWYFKTEVECDDTLELRLSHQQVFDLVEQCNNIDLREYYGISDIAFIDHVLKGYMWIHRLDGIVYTTYSDSIYYGNLTSFVCSTYLKKPVISIGHSDPLFYGPMPDVFGPMLPDSNVQQNINQAYKDALDEAIKENESLNDSLGGIYDLDGAFGSLNGSDLWATFRSLADGLASMGPAVRAIATLSGAVLAFMPLQVTGIIAFTLLALCIIAIIKAIRG